MVCEFLPVSYKRKLLDIASIEDLIIAGYSKKTAYQAKEKGIISDERCEKLIRVLGKRAMPILLDALHEFERMIQGLG
ncbi:hypothetical protein [Sulfurisphaera ohwakuensis]|uniref:Uncharacterized protein n=1 Tax=Sulfurisphaera ohwakuensis TaxID=69656 RepID=A0A650CDT3_SULOH|nr:hypothetical protein [Sulfurisphaera ohwakuensis]MBB5253141.1 hypothetical protein [Sulfurisphaera ohwakuensis]QGR15944.1 hypothetical protein D1869_01140 [Sulfurisphaera ohwakuensis]